MKGIKGRFLRKLKSIPTITSLKQGLVFHVNPSNQNFQTSPVYKEQEHKNNHPDLNSANICASKVLNDVKDEEMESGLSGGDRESLRPSIKSKDMVPAEHKAEIGTALMSGGDIVGTVPSSASTEVQQACDFQLDPLLEEIDTSHNFQQQQNTNTERLLDLKPVAASFEPIVMEQDTRCTEEFPTLSGSLEERCPPGGSESVILYTTSLRGIRKTFEDCNTIRFLLESFRVLFYERDVSMHLEFREELWRILGGRVVPPRLFINGRHIGGADEVVGLHEQGELKKLLQGIPLNPSNAPCNGCAGVRFILCSDCSGSCRLIPDDQSNLLSIRCPECNENGLVKCPLCC